MKDIHYTITSILRAVMFTVFGYNVIRVLVRTWKYGGGKSQVDMSFVGDDDDIFVDGIPAGSSDED